ncbi:hypothetical protein HS7_01800 [Sulfolobales archaeon HS-7]|nr:hypothetical protein HS7_01800 [Sulfolobales archaeon HS-7]
MVKEDIFCGIDLAVKRPSDVAVISEGELSIYRILSMKDIYTICKPAVLTGVDSPLSYFDGYREVDRAMIRNGFRVFPPNFLRELVAKALEIKGTIPVIETHPTSSMKILAVDWRSYTKRKDAFDAVLSALAAVATWKGEAVKISGGGETIYLVPKDYKPLLDKLFSHYHETSPSQ